MRHIRPAAGQFNQGSTPVIACINKAKTPLGVGVDKLLAALQEYVDRHVAPVWGTPAKLVKSSGFRKGNWAMVFVDNADEADLLAYHEITPDGMPLAKVFVKDSLAQDGCVSLSASHELAEMLVDPAYNLLTTGPHPKTFYAYECADPVEESSFKVKGMSMSDFVYPAYFEDFHKPGSVKFDHLNKLKRPFQILAGGYQTIVRNGKWDDSCGSAAKRRRLQREDRRGHRSEVRKQQARKAKSRR